MTNNFKRCECCGNYFEVNENNKDEKYCSEECKAIYFRCSICGDYYKLEDFFDKERLICSKECSLTHKGEK